MRKVLKWIGIGLGVLIGLLITAVLILYIMGGAQLNKTRQVQPADLTIPTDPEPLARGEHLVNAACKSCHSADLSGTAVLADPAVGTVYAANISGLGERRTEEEMLRAIRAVAQGEALFGPDIAARLITFFTSSQTSQQTQAFPELTTREHEVLDLIAKSLNNQAIATRLSISEKTVRNHVSNIFYKLQVADRSQAIVRARDAGMGL